MVLQQKQNSIFHFHWKDGKNEKHQVFTGKTLHLYSTQHQLPFEVLLQSIKSLGVQHYLLEAQAMFVKRYVKHGNGYYQASNSHEPVASTYEVDSKQEHNF